MKNLFPLFILFIFSHNVHAQYRKELSPKVSLIISSNIETYFFVEKLAVERIGNYVFNIKGQDYSHQPVVHFAFNHFKDYQNDPLIIRSAELLQALRDSLHDNGPIMDYLLNQKEFPASGPRFPGAEIDVATPSVRPLLAELTENLRKFYIQANVGKFLKKNVSFYNGVLQEAQKDIRIDAFPYMEKWYGREFPHYMLYLAPAMPITTGDDNYRGYGPSIASAEGKIPAMVISSSKMLPLQTNLSAYKKFGFDNPDVTRFLSSHEIGHTFVNPLVEKYASKIKADLILFTPELQEILSPHYITDWYVCVIEHLKAR
ncbi:DUF4932 domain-containing protein [Pontibacter sp. SGAir0037]|uniref:DUF4932 domain-containing protein n=1 Tax=Pontibacter sp. SGAir0037 TaxID=2571030 RepID=UPI0010CD62D9|nr:DUF4932 domain-containing protein [Pontibacter sp. SGAir0037]QCR24536.1 hypothetical protein C1N53_20695 [Pontibacter sp. SGAir0037]